MIKLEKIMFLGSKMGNFKLKHFLILYQTLSERKLTKVQPRLH